MKKLFISAALFSLCSASVLAASAFSSGEDAVEYRKHAFQLIRHNASDIGDMLQGKVTFDAARAQKRADTLVALSAMPWEAFSVEGANKASGDAKAEIWADFKDFSGKADKFQQDAKALQTAAASGDQAKLKVAFGTFRGNCKGCHEKYKAD